MNISAVIGEIKTALVKISSGEITKAGVEINGTSVKVYKVGEVIRIDIKESSK